MNSKVNLEFCWYNLCFFTNMQTDHNEASITVRLLLPKVWTLLSYMSAGIASSHTFSCIRTIGNDDHGITKVIEVLSHGGDLSKYMTTYIIHFTLDKEKCI